MIELTGFQQLLLLDIAIHERQRGRPPHGLAVRDDLTEMYRHAGNLPKTEQVNHGRLYPNLDQLVELGLLEKGERNKRTNWYGLTPAGAERIDRYTELLEVAHGADRSNPFYDEEQSIHASP